MKPFCCVLAAISLASCAQMNHLKTATVSGVSKVGGGVAKLSEASKESFAKLMPGPRIPVVQVRADALRDQPTGQEQALAFERTRRKNGGFWGNLFNGPVNFEEPDLPAESAAMDGDLLPPKLE
jgi:hypothetical protein